MKIIVCSNSNDVTPSDFQGGSQFRCHFNEVLTLPEDCEIAIGGFELATTDQERIFLVNLLNLPISNQIGNLRKGKKTATVGIISINNPLELLNGNTSYNPQRFRQSVISEAPEFYSLENTAPINLSFLDVQFTNQDGEPAVTFDNALDALGNTPEQTIVFYYRKRNQRN